LIDLRSDTVTQPTAEMREVMSSAEVGDDVYGEDPTINRLQSQVSNMTGMQAGLFVSSGTQSNLLALLGHCERGDEYIAGQDAHTYRYEGGGAAILGSIQPQPMEFNHSGELDLDQVSKLIKPLDYHFAKTRLLCLENTQGGKVLSLNYLQQARDFVDQKTLKLHLDGARVFNAAVSQQVDVAEITRYADSVSICLSKGLGAPAGSVLCGDAALIDRARRWRKVLGGGMRQAGILAAAGIYALENNVARLESDHHNAAVLHAGLSKIKGLTVHSVNTNMVMFTPDSGDFESLGNYLQTENITISGGRLVTHLDIDAEQIQQVIAAFTAFFK
jgi:threonine aldolase